MCGCVGLVVLLFLGFILDYYYFSFTSSTLFTSGNIWCDPIGLVLGLVLVYGSFKAGISRGSILVLVLLTWG